MLKARKFRSGHCESASQILKLEKSIYDMWNTYVSDMPCLLPASGRHHYLPLGCVSSSGPLEAIRAWLIATLAVTPEKALTWGAKLPWTESGDAYHLDVIQHGLKLAIHSHASTISTFSHYLAWELDM